MINELILRVEVDNTIYDLTVDSQVPLRVQMSAVESQELGKFFGIGSQTFSIPGTKQANKFFNHAYDIAQDDVPAMYNTLPCSVVLNGETVLIGALQLVSVVSSEDGYVTYNVQVADKVLQFEQALANKLITNANWSAYDHYLTSQSIVDSWTGGLLGGAVYYPVVDYGRTEKDSYTSAPVMQATGSMNTPAGTIASPDFPMNARQALPAIRVKDTLNVIFDQVGFNYTGSFTATEDFENLYILNKPNANLGILTEGNQTPLFKAYANVDQTVAIGYSGIVNANAETSDPTDAYYSTGSYYVAPENGVYTLSGRVAYENPIIPPNIDAILVTSRIEISTDSGATWITVATGNTNSLNAFSGVGPFQNAITFNGPLAGGTRVRQAVDTSFDYGGGSIDLTILAFLTRFECTVAPTTYEGAFVELGRQWEPQVKSLDILKGIITQFNLVMTPVPGDATTIQIDTFDNWIRSGEIKDWTYRFNTAKRVQVEHTVNELEREIFLQNITDNDRFSKTTVESAPNLQYGSLRILSENNISQGSKKIGDYFAPVILGGSVSYTYPDNIEKPFQGTYDINTATSFVLPHLYKFENSVQTSYTIKPRIGYRVTQLLDGSDSFYVGTPGSSIHVTDSYATIANVSSLPVVAGVSNDLHYNNTYPPFTSVPLSLNSGVNNFVNYWKNYLDSLYWEGSKKLTLDLLFEPYEYKEIGLNDRIIIKNQAYRINKISGFNISVRDVVTVELIKLYPGYWSLVPKATPTPTPTTTPTPTPTPTPTITPTPEPVPSITLGTATCRSGNCNDNATCGVHLPVNVYNAPVGYDVVMSTIFPIDATATYNQADGYVIYTEDNASASMQIKMDLYDTPGGTLLASTGYQTITHQSYWSMLPACS